MLSFFLDRKATISPLHPLPNIGHPYLPLSTFVKQYLFYRATAINHGFLLVVTLRFVILRDENCIKFTLQIVNFVCKIEFNLGKSQKSFPWGRNNLAFRQRHDLMFTKLCHKIHVPNSSLVKKKV